MIEAGLAGFLALALLGARSSRRDDPDARWHEAQPLASW